MPFLDATALDNDPAGMALLRAVIRPAPDEAALARRGRLAAALRSGSSRPSRDLPRSLRLLRPACS